MPPRSDADLLHDSYVQNQATPVGGSMTCPCCKKALIKKTYQHVFCKSKKRGRSSCKDRYWNITNPRGIHGGFA